MKYFSLLFAFLAFVGLGFAQNVYYDYQDGLVVFQLKENAKIINTVSSDSRVVAYEKIPELGVLKKYNVIEVLRLHPKIKDEKLKRTYQVQLLDVYKVDDLIAELRELKFIEYAELKEFHRTTLTPNDLGPNATNTGGTSPTSNQWSLHMIQAEEAWDIGIGDANVVVAVTDDAFLTTHVDLAQKIVEPYDATTQGTNPSPCGTNVGNHGTHVAGTIGAHTNNGTGVASIGYNISIMPIKIGNCNNQLTHGYEGIIRAADRGAHVVNMSWGGGGFSNYGQNVCNYAWNAGTILVAAAGNNNASTVFYPAGYNNVVSVASTTATDTRSSFSQYGTWVDIAAPGSNIRSTYATSLYNSISGTSMASPHVAGLLGLMRAKAPNATNTELINCLYDGADNIDAQNPSFIGLLGAGRINAYNSMVCAAQYAAEYDAAITEIITPSSTLCNLTFEPLVVLRNFGSQDLTSVAINYSWDGTPLTFNWTGLLLTGESEEVSLPALTVSNGTNTFEASTSMPNGQNDQNPANDDTEQDFTVDIDGQEVTLTIFTDCWGSETTWQIINDDNGQIVQTGGPYEDNTPLEEHTHSFCLPAACYTFKIFDEYGDGMNGSNWQTCSVDGDYFMQNSSNDTIFEMTAANANFGASEDHPFCIIPAGNFHDAGIQAIVSPNIFTCGSDFSPTVNLRNYGLDTLESAEITYGLIGGNQATFSWTGNLPSGQIESVTLPSISGSVGNATLFVQTSLPNAQLDNNMSNDSLTKSFSINSQPGTLPFLETFETNVIASGKWNLDNPDNEETWNRVPVGGITPGSNAMKMDFFNYLQAGRRDGLISPPIDLSGYQSATMTFDHAYRRFDQSLTDSLIVYVSTDCGISWERVFQAGENGTGTFATQTTSSTAFTPSQAVDWCFDHVIINGQEIGADCFEIDLTDFVGETVVVKFESFNAGTLGNNLYLDNINIEGVPNSGMPIPSFQVADNTICPGDVVQFNDNSTGNVTNWEWTFQGGTPSTSTDQNPTVTYNSTGSFNVTLTVTNALGSITTVENSFITVSSAPSNPFINQNGNVLSVFTQIGEVATWFLNGNVVGTGSSYTMTQGGVYTVEISNAAGCRKLSGEFVSTVSLNDELMEEIQVYPNPSESNFTIDFGQNEVQSVYVIDALGKKVYEKSSPQIGEETINLYHLANGIYMVVINNGNFEKAIKIEVRK